MSPETIRVPGPAVDIVGDRWQPSAAHAEVVLLHGGGQTRHSWAQTASSLASGGYAVTTYDARGHGDSGWDSGGDYRLETMAEDLNRVLAWIGAPNPVVVGASLGGWTALVASAEDPGRLAGLVLVDVVVDLEPDGVERIEDFMRARPEGFGSLEEVAEAVQQYNPLRRRPRNLESLRKNVRRGEDGRWRWHWDPAFLRTSSRRRREEVPLLRAAAGAVTAPTLLVRGARSDVISDEGVSQTLDLIPHAQTLNVVAGHMVAGDDNDVFTEGLVAFLAGPPTHA